MSSVVLFTVYTTHNVYTISDDYRKILNVRAKADCTVAIAQEEGLRGAWRCNSVVIGRETEAVDRKTERTRRE